jgi:hypothetical protein
MSTVQEIKVAIQNLSPREREELAACLPGLVPELDGDAAWERIIRDARPRPALSSLLNQVEADFRADPTALPEMTDAEFDRHA